MFHLAWSLSFLYNTLRGKLEDTYSFAKTLGRDTISLAICIVCYLISGDSYVFEMIIVCYSALMALGMIISLLPAAIYDWHMSKASQIKD